MNTLGTCSICGGEVVALDGKGAVPKCSACGAEAESAYGATVKMKSTPTPSMDGLRATLEAVVDRWCPKTNPQGKPTEESFDQRMVKALLHVAAFEIDYRRVMAGGKPLDSTRPSPAYPLPLPIGEKTLVS